MKSTLAAEFDARDAGTVLGAGSDAVVWRLIADGSVRKRYRGLTTSRSTARAYEEFSALRAAGEALKAVPGVSCPMPYSVDVQRGELIMEFCDADRLDHALSSERFADASRLNDIARAIGASMACLSCVLDVDQLDFSVRNTLVHRSDNQVILIDFTRKSLPDMEGFGSRGSAIERSIASFLSSTITYQMHQDSILSVTVSSRLRTIARLLFEHLTATEPIDLETVRTFAWRYYWRQGGNRGRKRYIWFHTFGALYFRAMLYRATREKSADP